MDLGSALAGELVSLILNRANGFYAFESAVHVFPLEAHSGSHGIVSWNVPELWRNWFDGMADGLVFFAEDIFGGLFGTKGDAAARGAGYRAHWLGARRRRVRGVEGGRASASIRQKCLVPS